MRKEVHTVSITQIEDYLDEREDVFISGIDGRSCNMDSYMTVLNYKALERAFKEAPFTRLDWQAFVFYWDKNPNGIAGQLAGKEIKRLLEKEVMLETI